jgi:hypothetical protein
VPEGDPDADYGIRVVAPDDLDRGVALGGPVGGSFLRARRPIMV